MATISCASKFTYYSSFENEQSADQDSRDQRWHMVFSLFLAFTLRTLLVIISFGCKVPAGIFVPSMAIGAAFGRMIGILVEALHESFPTSTFFSACLPDQPCITPGTYAFLGAAAALSGIMHITVSVVVIMFEITGALTYILPTMIVVGVTKAVSERFGHGGIADRMIYLNGYPFLDNKEDHTFGVPVSSVMSTSIASLPASGIPLRSLETIMNENAYQGYPIVSDPDKKILLGYIGRTELRYALDKARADTPGASSSSNPTVFFTPQPESQFQSQSQTQTQTPSLNLTKFTDPTPLTVHPRLPLETVMEIFKKMGPRAILIEYRGRLTGLVTVKDCLKYQFRGEGVGHGAGGGGAGGAGEDDGMEWLNGVVVAVATRIDGLWQRGIGVVGLGRRGAVRLQSPVVGRTGERGGFGNGEEEELVDRGRGERR